jgi:hypothetical protein
VRLIPTTSDDESGIPAAERTAELFFRHWCSIYGIPKSIVSDRDPQFTSIFWTYLFQLYTTTLKFSSSYHPETDGQTERTNRTLEEVLRAYVVIKCDLSFNVGDYVWVSTRNMKAQGDNSEKLKSKYAGPYKILRKINQVSYELQLPEVQRAHGVHPVYHVSKLRKFIPRLESFADDSGNELPPPPALIDDEGYDQWEVEAVLNKKRVGNKVKYLIKWKGYSAYNNTWEPVEHLMNAKEYIEEFEAAQAEKKRIEDELHASSELKANIEEGYLPDVAHVHGVACPLPAHISIHLMYYYSHLVSLV